MPDDAQIPCEESVFRTAASSVDSSVLRLRAPVAGIGRPCDRPGAVEGSSQYSNVTIESLAASIQFHEEEAVRLRVELESKIRMLQRYSARPGVSDRECQVLMQVRSGLSNKEISSNLNISERTVKAHVSSLLRKYGITSHYMARTKL